MPRYLIEACADGSLFAESIDAPDMEAAEAGAVKRLIEADYGYPGDTDLADIGDYASVTEYQPVDYAKDEAMRMLELLRSVAEVIDTTDPEHDSFLDSGSDTIQCLCEIEQAIRSTIAKAEGRAL